MRNKKCNYVGDNNCADGPVTRITWPDSRHRPGFCISHIGTVRRILRQVFGK